MVRVVCSLQRCYKLTYSELNSFHDREWGEFIEWVTVMFESETIYELFNNIHSVSKSFCLISPTYILLCLNFRTVPIQEVHSYNFTSSSHSNIILSCYLIFVQSRKHFLPFKVNLMQRSRSLNHIVHKYYSFLASCINRYQLLLILTSSIATH